MKGCKVLSGTEVKSMMAAASKRDLVLLLTGLNFGLRISESLALTFGDVAGSFLSVKSAKGSNNVTFPIPANYTAALDSLKAEYVDRGKVIDDTTPLFLSRKGVNQSITRQQASKIVRDLAAALGIEGKVNTHSLRKSFVTRIFEKTGFNIAETKKYSRHKNLANLDYYIGTTEDTDLVNSLNW